MIFQIIVVTLLCVIGVLAYFGKPIKIEIKHVHESNSVVVPEKTTSQGDIDKAKESTNTLDAVVSALHEIMGVNEDEQRK